MLGVIFSEHIIPDIDVFINSVIECTEFNKVLLARALWVLNDGSFVHNRKCELILTYGIIPLSIFNVINYRGTALHSSLTNQFIPNPFHPIVRFFTMVSEENMFLSRIRDIVTYGDYATCSTHNGTYSIHNTQLEFNLQGNVLPLLTFTEIKYVHLLNDLSSYNSAILLNTVMNGLKSGKTRTVFQSPNVMLQFYVTNTDTCPSMNCHATQTTGDMFSEIPINIARYALMTHMISHVLGLNAHTLTLNIGDSYIDSTDTGVFEKQLILDYDLYDFPTIQFKRLIHSIDDFTTNDFVITNYKHH